MYAYHGTLTILKAINFLKPFDFVKFIDYSVAMCTSCRIGRYRFKYLPFIHMVRPSRVNAYISHALFENVCKILKVPSQFGDHFPNNLSLRSIGNITFQTRSLTSKVFDLTFLL